MFAVRNKREPPASARGHWLPLEQKYLANIALSQEASSAQQTTLRFPVCQGHGILNEIQAMHLGNRR